MIHALDLTNKASVEALFATIESLRIEAVINNAGAAFGRDPLPDAADEDLEAMIELDITAFLRVARLCIPHLKKSHGHLLNVGSIAGLEVYEGATTYCGAKSFVHAVTKGLRIDLLGSGIRVTEIAPGNVDTEFSAVRYKGDLARAKKVYEGYEPLHAEDIAEAMWFALSRPAHVNIEHMLIMPTAQASAMRVARKEA
jgi:NADP-dependent 3-hydroxy acid dehydrogenase YdfG